MFPNQKWLTDSLSQWVTMPPIELSTDSGQLNNFKTKDASASKKYTKLSVQESVVQNVQDVIVRNPFLIISCLEAKKQVDQLRATRT